MDRLITIILAGWAAAAFAAAGASIEEQEAALRARMAREGTNTALLFQLGELWHDDSVSGNRQAVLKSETYLQELLALAPSNAPALALLGSVQTIKARDTFWPNQQLRFVREGIALMDRAVSLAPEDPRTRVIRCLNNAHMPAFLGRSEIVRADLAWVWEKIEKAPELFTTGEKQEAAFYWGKALKGEDQCARARQVWETGVSFGPGTRRATRLRAELARLPDVIDAQKFQDEPRGAQRIDGLAE